MVRIKRGAMIASSLMLVAMIASACNQPYSQPPSVTNTPINPDSLFATPLGQPTNMTDVQNFATGTALAILNGTPGAGVATAMPAVNTTPLAGGSPTITPTSIIQLRHLLLLQQAKVKLSTRQCRLDRALQAIHCRKASLSFAWRAALMLTQIKF